MSSKLYKEYINKLERIEPYSSPIHADYGNLNKEYAEKFKTENDDKSFKFLLLEADLISIGKSIDSGLTPMTSGTGKDENGQEVEIIWPDYRKYGDSEFSYFLKRYNETTNVQLKAEYGLLLFICEYLQHVDERKELYKSLWIAIQNIYTENWNKRNRHYLSSLIKNALILSIKSKFNTEIKQIVLFLQNEFLNKKPDELGYYTFYYIIVDYLIPHKRIVSSIIDVNKITNKAIQDALQLEQNNDFNSAESIITKLLKFKSLFQVQTTISLEKFLGIIYEKIGDKESERKNVNGGPHFYTESIKYFKIAKSDVDVQRIYKKYESTRGKIKLGSVKSELSEQENEAVNEWVNNIVENANRKQIIQLWGLYTQLQKKSDIEEAIEKRPLGIQNFISHSSMDKFGNTVEKFITEPEIKENQFWFEYGMEYQMGIQLLVPILVKTMENKRFSEEDVISYFESSWLNEPIQRFYNSELIEVVPFDIIKPSIQEFFRQFNGWIDKRKSNKKNLGQIICRWLCFMKKEEPENISFICAIDSLSMKVEPVLRFMCERLGLNTTIQKTSRNKYDVIRQKTLGYLLKTLVEENMLTEDDVVFLNYTVIYPERANLRNNIAHGLTDLNEYHPARAIQLISILIRLSNYKFIKKEA